MGTFGSIAMALPRWTDVAPLGMKLQEYDDNTFERNVASCCIHAGLRGQTVRRLIKRYRGCVQFGFYSVSASRLFRGGHPDTEDLRLALWVEAQSKEADANLLEEDHAARQIQALLQGHITRRILKANPQPSTHRGAISPDWELMRKHGHTASYANHLNKRAMLRQLSSILSYKRHACYPAKCCVLQELKLKHGFSVKRQVLAEPMTQRAPETVDTDGFTMLKSALAAIKEDELHPMLVTSGTNPWSQQA